MVFFTTTKGTKNTKSIVANVILNAVKNLIFDAEILRAAQDDNPSDVLPRNFTEKT